jgi:CRP-like cAMP-binding protein
VKPTPEVRERLRRFALVQQLAGADELLDMLIEALRPARFPAGADIVAKGDAGTEAYLLVEGTVEIVDFTMQSEPYVKAVFSDNFQVVFGEMALVSQDVRTATVRARTACTCWVLRRDDFLRLGEAEPRLGWAVLLAIARLLAERLKRTNQDVLRLFEALVLEVEDDAGGRQG